MKVAGLFMLLLSLGAGISACSTGTVRFQDQASRGNIEFSRIESLAFGQMDGNSVIRLIGRPDRIEPLINAKTDAERWVYLEQRNGKKQERLIFTVTRGTGTLQAAIWMPFEGEQLFAEQGVLGHFSGARFVKDVSGWVADTYSEDATYVDKLRGISFYVWEGRREVEMIAFGVPQQNIPATEGPSK